MTRTTNGGTDVLVIGAGPTGLTAAAEAARHGLSVRIVDREAEPSRAWKACVLWPRTLEVFDLMGVPDEASRIGAPLHRMDIFAYGNPLGSIRIDGSDSPRRTPIFVGQDETERILAEHLGSFGVKVERSVEATGLEQDEGGVTVALKKPDGSREAARALWVVGAEGSRSLVREAAGIPFEGERFGDLVSMQVDAKVRWALPEPEGHAFFFVGEDGYLGALPMPGGYWRFFMGQPDPDPEDSTLPTKGQLEARIGELSATPVELYDVRSPWKVRFQHKVASGIRAGRTFLVGDAVKVVAPVSAQGMNAGIQDSFNLAWKLAHVTRGEAPDSLLDSYEAERLPFARTLLARTRGILLAAEGATPLRKAVVGRAGPRLLGLGYVQDRVRAFYTQLEVSYPESPLSADPLAARSRWWNAVPGPRAGERAPDAPVFDAARRESTTLFEGTRGTGWTLLMLSEPGATAKTYAGLSKVASGVERGYGGRVRRLLVAPDAAQPTALGWMDGGSWVAGDPDRPLLLDPARAAHRKYGALEAARLYLLRPDGRVGFRGAPEDAGALEGYLSAVLSTGNGGQRAPDRRAQRSTDRPRPSEAKEGGRIHARDASAREEPETAPDEAVVGLRPG
jgi:2-polyprenyl-6-methoxyphenol hydroxylase-like FAD-dependent oxidoreductase